MEPYLTVCGRDSGILIKVEPRSEHVDGTGRHLLAAGVGRWRRSFQLHFQIARNKQRALCLVYFALFAGDAVTPPSIFSKNLNGNLMQDRLAGVLKIGDLV